MDVIEKFLNEVSWKFDKGYPDITNEQDILMLERLLKEIGVEFNLSEANMVGQATGFPGPLGTWEKYIENAWNKHEKGKTLYKAIKSTPLLRVSPEGETEKSEVEISIGDEFTINSDSTKDLIKIGSQYYGPIGYKGEEYFFALNSILKPTGKQVEKLTPDLASKTDPSVYHPFTPGHPQEGKVAMLFIEETNQDWEFEDKGKKLKVTYLGDPNYKGTGYPKNDLQVNISPSPEGLESPLKISLKADNATYVENWMTAARGEQILGDKLKPIVLGAYNALLKSNPQEDATGLFAGKLKSYQISMFIKDRAQKYGPEAPSILSQPLSKEEAYEAYTGDDKFGDSDGSANYFYKGKDPETISEFLSNLKSFKNNMGDLSDLYVSLRGTNEAGKRRSRVFYREEGKWFINPLWVEAAGITETEDEKGNTKYS